MKLPPEQEAIRAKCFHPSGSFIEFKKEEVEQSVPERFEKIVRMFPDRLAVKAGTNVWTYDKLNKFANRIAHTILSQSERREEPIALMLEKGAPQIAAILGVLKTGKIYVPLDPSFPSPRTSYILKDSGARLIVTNNRHLSSAEQLVDPSCQVINLDEQASGLSTENPGLTISPDCSSCVMYSSGSTGKPKGVIQNHRNLLHWVMVHTNNLHICENDRLSLLQSYSVASCIHNLFGSLLNGASLFPADPQLGGAQLARWLVDEKITIYHSVPLLFRLLTEALTGNEELHALRVIRLSGAATSRRDVSLYKKYFSQNCILVQVMGTTEAGTIPHYFLDKTTELNGMSVPVGYAEPDAEIILLDEKGCRVSAGQVGEIAVKSRYLAPGYWQNGELTKSKFLADPQAEDQRIYLTGDLGRMEPDGCLFYLGRKDFQANVRGFRVEVGEVEAALSTLDLVKAAVVQAQPDGDGNQGLVAYVVPAPGEAPTQGRLRRGLEQILPYYMIPSVFVFLETLPLLPNGKVDRRALPEPGRSRPQLETLMVVPRTSMEAGLARIWAEVLSLDDVGIHDNFFDLGGHSLAASRVVSRVIQVFQLDLPVQSLFQAPTIAEMSAAITQSQAKKLSEEDLARVLADLESLSEEQAREVVDREVKGNRDE